MPAMEQHTSGDRVQQQAVDSTHKGLQNVQHDAWGPKAVRGHAALQTNALDEFGHVTISNSAQVDPLRSWCAKPFTGFEPPAGLKAAEKQLAHSNGSIDDHVRAFEVGTVKAVYAVGNGISDMANAFVSPPARLGDWLANTLVEPALAIEDSGKFGDDVGKALVKDAKVLQSVGTYAADVLDAQAKGDYLKPVTDIANFVDKERANFEKLTSAQKTGVVTEQVVGLGIAVATGKLLSAAPEAFAGLLEKMDAFKVKAEANRLHFGIETSGSKSISREKLSAEHSFRNPREVHHEEGEKHFAGANNNRFKYEEIEKVRSLEVPIQCHKNACVAAVGEILTKGKIGQHTLVQKLEQYLLPEIRGKESLLALQDLASELRGSGWEFRTVSKTRGIDYEPLFKELIATKQPFAVTFKAFQVEAHAVVVDSVNAAGRVVIRDPGEGTIYQMKMQDFMDHWTGQAVAKR